MGEKLIAKMQCSSCEASYFAELVEVGGRWDIGPKIDPPKETKGIRVQRMQCGDCRAKNGDDPLTRLMRQQRDPYGLGL